MFLPRYFSIISMIASGEVISGVVAPCLGILGVCHIKSQRPKAVYGCKHRNRGEVGVEYEDMYTTG